MSKFKVMQLNGLELRYRHPLFFSFLSAFAKLRKASVSLVTSVRPSAWNNWTPTGRISMKFDI